MDGLDGVEVTHTDDVLIFDSNQSEHDTRLNTVLERLESRGVTLNGEKWEFSTNSVKFLGHIVERNGIRADTDKTRAIQELDRLENVTELRRILGMANQLGRFAPTLAGYLSRCHNPADVHTLSAEVSAVNSGTVGMTAQMTR